MRTFIVGLAFCVTLTYTHALQLDDIRKFHAGKVRCIAETGIDEKLVFALITGEEINRNDKLDCFASCLLKHVKLQRPDGTFDFELAHNMAVKSNINVAQYDAVVQKCKNVEGKNDCDKTGNLFECFVHNHISPIPNSM